MDRPGTTLALPLSHIFQSVVGAPDYPCIGARSVLRQERATVRGYHPLAGAETARVLLHDLSEFAATTDLSDGFASFVAVFPGDRPATEEEFEALLWKQLQQLRDCDPFPPDPSVSDVASDPHFAFSVAGSAYFVVGLHPAASRPARQAPCAMLIFNPHEQFEKLRREGRYDRIRDTIRRRDEAANGSINAMVADHGDSSEARQYSGRAVGPDWVAPFDGHSGCPYRGDN